MLVQRRSYPNVWRLGCEMPYDSMLVRRRSHPIVWRLGCEMPYFRKVITFEEQSLQ